MCLTASPSSLSPPASRLLFFVSFPICSLLLFLFSSPFLSNAVSFSFCCPGRSNPGPQRPRTLQSRASIPQMFQSGCVASPDVPLRDPYAFVRLPLPPGCSSPRGPVASDGPVRGTGCTPGRSSPGVWAVLQFAADAPIRGVILSYSLRCVGCSSPWHRVHPRTIQSGG